MPNMSLKKNEMPSQEPNVRNKNFKEVALGYSPEQAIDEAKRCLNCKHKPCVSGCPVKIHIPDFIAKVAEGKFEEAYQIIHQSSSLPAVCGRVCPQETQCEQKCVRGLKGEPVAIGRLERFVADYHNQNVTEKATPVVSNHHKVAVIGSGPSGLTCAGDLAKLGYEVTVFEALHLAGGVLVYGIPEFRLPKAIVQKEIDTLTFLTVLRIAAAQINTAIVNKILNRKLCVQIKFQKVMKSIAKLIENQFELNYILPIIGELIDGFVTEHLIYIFVKDEKDNYKLFWPLDCQDSSILSLLPKITNKKTCYIINGATIIINSTARTTCGISKKLTINTIYTSFNIINSTSITCCRISYKITTNIPNPTRIINCSA